MIHYFSFRLTCGVHRRSKGLWDIIKPMPVCLTAGTKLGYFLKCIPLYLMKGDFFFQVFVTFALRLFRSPTPCALKIADKIAEQFDSAVLLMVMHLEVINLFFEPFSPVMLCVS